MSVDPSAGGKFELVSSHWRWPDSDGVGCPENETPNMLATPDGDMQLDFTTNWGFIVAVDAAGSGNVTSSVKATTSQLAFDGFTSWSVAADGASLAGITPAAAQHGFCSDGCFQYGRESWPAGVYSAFRGPGCVLGGGVAWLCRARVWSLSLTPCPCGVAQQPGWPWSPSRLP